LGIEEIVGNELPMTSRHLVGQLKRSLRGNAVNPRWGDTLVKPLRRCGSIAQDAKDVARRTVPSHAAIILKLDAGVKAL
jgi:hypothetical protein